MGFLAAVPAAIGTMMTASTASATALAAASSTLTATAATIGAGTALYGGYSAYKQGQYQAKVASENLKINAMNEEAAGQEALVSESLSREATGRKIGAAKAQLAANGVDVGFGSAEDITNSIADAGDLDAQTIRYNAARQAMGFAVTRSSLGNQISSAKAGGKNALVGGVLGAGSSFIGGASSLSGQANRYRMNGLGT